MKKMFIPLVLVGLLWSCDSQKDAFSAMDDANFKAYCEQFDTNQNGKLSDEECSVVTKIDVSGKKDELGAITSLKGIEYFTNLDTLNCSYNQITSLDLSQNTALVWLSCDGNQLTTLDVSNNDKLTILKCDSNQLTTLDLSNNIELINLNCSNNQLSTLDLTKNEKLAFIYCSNNQFTSLDLSKIVALKELICGAEHSIDTIYLERGVTIRSSGKKSNTE